MSTIIGASSSSRSSSNGGASSNNGERQGYAKGRATRQQILDRAVELFGEVGYRAASLREIAARCGISHPGLMHHFPSKPALLAAVLAERDRIDSDRYLPQAASGLDQLRGLVALVEHNTHVPAMVELHARLSAEAGDPGHPAHDWFVERYVRTREGFGAVFARAAADGILRPGVDPVTAAVVLTAVMDGLQVQWLLDRGAVDMVGALREHLAGVLTAAL